MTKRAIRRHHADRMERRARKMLSVWGRQDAARRLRDNMAVCSCDMCTGHKDEPSIQELRAPTVDDFSIED